MLEVIVEFEEGFPQVSPMPLEDCIELRWSKRGCTVDAVIGLPEEISNQPAEGCLIRLQIHEHRPVACRPVRGHHNPAAPPACQPGQRPAGRAKLFPAVDPEQSAPPG